MTEPPETPYDVITFLPEPPETPYDVQIAETESRSVWIKWSSRAVGKNLIQLKG